jgi:hypothetical protein
MMASHVPSRLNSCGIAVVVLGSLVFQYLFVSLFLFASEHTTLYNAATHSILFPPPPAIDPSTFSCRACRPFDFLGTRAFSCEACNATQPLVQRTILLTGNCTENDNAVPDEDGLLPYCPGDVVLSEADLKFWAMQNEIPLGIRLLNARREAIDNYYDNDTFLFRGAICGAFDSRHCRTGFTDRVLGSTLDMEPVTVHPVAVLSALIVLVVTLLEALYIHRQVKVERARVDAVVARHIIQDVSRAQQHTDFKEHEEELPIDSLFDKSIFGLPISRPNASLIKD